MTITKQIKILDDKIRSSQAQYDLGRQNAKISALSSGELDKYEYLTGEDLGYKPDVVQKVKSEYSPLGQAFNTGLNKNEKQEGLLKRLKNIEDKADNQLDLIKDQGNKQLNRLDKIINPNKTKAIDLHGGPDKELKKKLVDRARKDTDENEDQDKIFTHTISDKTFDFSKYINLSNFGSKIFTGKLSLSKVKNEQKNISNLIDELEEKLNLKLGRQLKKDNKQKTKKLINDAK